MRSIFKLATYSWLFSEFKQFLSFLKIYIKDKIIFVSSGFESSKGTLVHGVLIKRGRQNRLFLHISAMAVLTVGIIISPFVSDSNLFGAGENLSFAQSAENSAITTTDVFNTQESQKPRDKVITYTVQNGDTLGTIAKKFGISAETIKWQNDMDSDTINVGESLEILPVSGVAHKVVRGDTVYTIAKKYGVDAQGIVDFPFNDFANPQTFSLIEGEVVIVPDGVPPAKAPTYVRPQQYIATGPVTVSGGGFTWPIHGTLNQGYFWYHPGVDLGAPIGTPVLAAQSGVAAQVFTSGWNGGYGTHVIIQGDNGYRTLYAHMMAVNVSAGSPVVAGKTVVGWVGMTGRTTGPHLHFEIRSSGGTVNPLSML